MYLTLSLQAESLFLYFGPRKHGHFAGPPVSVLDKCPIRTRDGHVLDTVRKCIYIYFEFWTRSDTARQVPWTRRGKNHNVFKRKGGVFAKIESDLGFRTPPLPACSVFSHSDRKDSPEEDSTIHRRQEEKARLPTLVRRAPPVKDAPLSVRTPQL